MNLLDFIASLISSIAWPSAVIVLALIFREKLREIIHAIAERIADMSELSGPGSLNAKFEKGVREVTDVTSKFESRLNADQPASADHAQNKLVEEVLDSMAYTSPRHAVLEAYIPLEKAAYNLIEHEGGSRKDIQMMLRNPIAALRRIGGVPKDLVMSASELRHLRNQAAHQEVFDVEPEVVLDYVDAARDLTRSIESIAKNA
ncbi:hypothetical protein JTF08_10935 [Micrococcaceae bacterium RIT802]|nr:hypothetical protein [Micrococcaceae bacterium RIT 802]